MMKRRERWVCFPCRKVWRKPFAPVDGLPYYRNRVPVTFTCPSCKAKLVDMGYRFRPPRRNDKRAWKYLAEYVNDFETKR
jgi:hypothetical protein